MRLTIPSSGDVCRLADNYGPLLAGLFGHGPLSPFPQSFRTKIRNSLAMRGSFIFGEDRWDIWDIRDGWDADEA